MLTALLVLASAVSAPAPTQRVLDLVEAARVTCPSAPPPNVIRDAASRAHFSKRDTDLMFALCEMYHRGRADQARATLNEMLAAR